MFEEIGEWGWFAIAAAGIALICMAVTFLLRRQPASGSLDRPAPDDSKTDLVLGDMTEVLSRGLPGTHRDQEEVLPELRRAGYYSSSALVQYRAVRTVMILTPLFAAAAIAIMVPTSRMPWVALIGLAVASLGYSIPRLYLYLKAQGRSREIERGLPVFADMLSLALLAGQGLLLALNRVTAQLARPFPRMAEELQLVNRQAELLNLAAAFDQWAVRSQVTEVRNIAVILTQSVRLGNDVSTALMEYASAMRIGSRQRAEGKAQRASFWMLFPTILCLWIPAAVILVAPIFFEFGARQRQAREAMPDMGKDSAVGKILVNPNKKK